MKRIVIIGGGIGGLATAGILASRGYKIDLYEARDQFGGRMGLLEHNGFRFDTGPSWYLMPDVYEHFFRLVGSTAGKELKLKRLTPAYRIFAESADAPITIYGDESRDGATFESREAGSSKKLTRYLDSAERTYRLSLKHFLYTDFRKPLDLMSLEFLPYGPTMLKKAYQSLDKHVSTLFKDPVLKQILEYPAVFLGGSPFTIPSIYHLMSYLDFRQGVFYPEGGMYSVTEAAVRLAKKHGAQLHLNKAVKRILVEQGSASAVELMDGTIVTADIVVSNSDLEYTQRQLLPEQYQDYPSKFWQKSQAGPSALLMYLEVEGALPELEHHNLFFVKEWKQNFTTVLDGKAWPKRASMYVSKPGQTDATAAPKGYENLFVLVPLQANTAIVPKDLEARADSFIDQFAKQAGIVNLKQRIHYRRLFQPEDFEREYHSWNGTALGLSHTFRQSSLFRPATKSKKVRGLYYVGANVQPGVGVPMCLISAELVAKDILGVYAKGQLKESMHV